jgi:hypothetical protein
MEKTTFGAGCFWGVESFFREVPVDAVCGYAGGTLANFIYKQVCSDTTGHAEVVQVTYDPAKASYDRLLDVWPCLRRIGNIAIGRRRADQARTSPNTWKMAATRPSFSRQEERRPLGASEMRKDGGAIGYKNSERKKT